MPGLTETGKLLFNRATLKVYDRPTLRAVIQAIHDMDLAAHEGQDLKGDMYDGIRSSSPRLEETATLCHQTCFSRSAALLTDRAQGPQTLKTGSLRLLSGSDIL